MAVWSQVLLSDTPGLRLDPEYYKPCYLELKAKLESTNPVTVEEFAYVTDGIHSSPDWVENGGVPYLSAKCVKDNYFDLTNMGKISQKQNNQNPRTKARLEDVLLTTVGTIGNAAVVYEQILPANMDRHLGIIRIQKTNTYVDPYYLATFINSKFGRFQTMREATGNVQLNLFIDKIKQLLVPVGENFNKLGEITREAYDKHLESNALYAEAEAFLLQELGLDSLDLSPQIAHTANFSETMKMRRLDAEYWGHQYTKLVDYLREIPHNSLAQLASFSNGATPRGAEYLDTGIPFLRIQNVSKNTLNLDDVVYIDEMTHNKLLRRSQLKPGDVLVTITGRIGTSAVVPKDMAIGNINQHIVRLRLKCSDIRPYYISTFLNSTFGLLQTEREAYGTTRDALPYYCLERVIVPKASEDLQFKVEQKILEAERSLSEAKILLEKAKYKVEKMILSEALENERPQ